MANGHSAIMGSRSCTIKGAEERERGMKPFVNKDQCSAEPRVCKAMRACPNDAIGYTADDNEPLGGRIVIDESLCSGCGQCAEACCGSAVEMR
jgi:Pyruvate/2-oxoacid:ferredoxin oxidoreductase delta subunit